MKVSLLRCIFVTAYMRASCTLRAVTCAASCSGARLWKPSERLPVVTGASQGISVQDDGIICKQAQCVYLCGIALVQPRSKTPFRRVEERWGLVRGAGGRETPFSIDKRVLSLSPFQSREQRLDPERSDQFTKLNSKSKIETVSSSSIPASRSASIIPL